ncbi:tail fiber assembly protein [Burkholderia glumae]|uniref:tail fiber assembly protein n=1 Tax=Burkholderia glumae TaxID=337 RepID=UPI001295C27A|nr:tail fiber assembly protein [Burkholderia glumae]MCM2551370.1 tail fiber assembly protein [Burkholderia glumae]MCR1769593.1 tail fiber assembly protein [Burkholderia glumae]NVE25699.1 tail fiber assembly protein [Burkholderia glumae]QGA39719.1 tail assembly chaperone [Burkholderia glumae]QHP93382.1 tail assembly chaperone [Burkholderia glumae]
MSVIYAAFDTQRHICAFGDDQSMPEALPFIEISEDEQAWLLEGAANGKVMAVDDKERPILLDPAPPSPDQIRARNTAYRDWLLERASVALTPLQTAMLLGNATEAETALARQWIVYARALKKVDLGVALPDWPAAPAIAGSN